jgi:hypothetical protein
MAELVKVFGEAWRKEERNSISIPGQRRVPGARREAGLHAVLDVLERDYIVVEREDGENL